MEMQNRKTEMERPADRPTGRPADRPTGRPAGRPSGRPADRPTGRGLGKRISIGDDVVGGGSALMMMMGEEVQKNYIYKLPIVRTLRLLCYNII